MEHTDAAPMMYMHTQETNERADLDLDTEVFLAIVCKVPLSAVEHVKRLLAAHGSRIIYQRLAAEPLRVMTHRKYCALGGDDDDSRALP